MSCKTIHNDTGNIWIFQSWYRNCRRDFTSVLNTPSLSLKSKKAVKLLPILWVMPWMSWATSSCPEAMRAFSWLRRCRLSVSELSICSWPSFSFPCWVCRALWPSSSLSSEAAVSSFSSSWPSWVKKQRRTIVEWWNIANCLIMLLLF